MKPQPKQTKELKDILANLKCTSWRGVYKYPQFVLPEHAFNTSSSPCSYICLLVMYGVTSAEPAHSKKNQQKNSHNRMIKRQIKRLRVLILWQHLGQWKQQIATLCCLKSCPLYHRSQQPNLSSDVILCNQKHAKLAAQRKKSTGIVFD